MSTKKQGSDRAAKQRPEQSRMREAQRRPSSARTERSADSDPSDHAVPRHSPTSTYHPGDSQTRH